MNVGSAREQKAPSLATLLPMREVVLPWLVSRAYSAALITTVWSARLGGIRFGGFTTWDGRFYFAIARSGYGPPPFGGKLTPWPFFPFLPGVIRVLSALGAHSDGGIVVFNHVVFLLALAGVWRIAQRHIGHVAPEAARLAVWSLALFPGAFVFSMAYPSAVFLAASVWAFALVEERHDVAAGVLVGVAALVRPNGIVLAVALVLAVRSFRRVLVVCVPAVAALGAWCLLCWNWTGNPLVFLDAKNAWREVTALGLLKHPKGYAFVYPHLLLALAAMTAVLVCRRRLPRSWTAFTALYLMPSLGLGMVGLGRYANETFPPFVAAGELLHRMTRALRVVMFGLAVMGQALCAWWVFNKLGTP
jgi:hypothetical protein